MIIMGIDPSMRSTGICTYNTDTGEHKYVLIVSCPTKKVAGFKHDIIDIQVLNKEEKTESGVINAMLQTKKIYNIILGVKHVIMSQKPDKIIIEAPALRGCGQIVELAGLNHAIRMLSYEYNIPIYPITPTSNKMEFVGNGQATKDMMVTGWEMSDPNSKLLPLGKHREDLADAYALTHFPVDKYL